MKFLKALILFTFLWISTTAEAANYAGASTIWQIMSGATAANANGGGFDPANANFPTDGAATVATGGSAVFSSASYNFVAGDVGAWLYIKSGTNWNANCWYQIASVASNAATLSSGANQGICQSATTSLFGQQSAAGVASTASPTGATWGVDYSQQTAAQFTATTATGTTTAFTDTTHAPNKAWVGNIIHIISGTGVTVGWYECSSDTSVTCTLDRTAGTSYTGVTYNMGGAASLGSSTTNQTDANFFSQVSFSTTACPHYFIQGGTNITYTIGQSINSSACTGTAQGIYEGYSSYRGDRPTGATRPTWILGANTLTTTSDVDFESMQFTGTAAAVVSVGSYNIYGNDYFINTSTTANRAAIIFTSVYNMFKSCEFVSERGRGIDETSTASNSNQYYGNYFHDSVYGIYVYNGIDVFVNNIFANNTTGDLYTTSNFIASIVAYNTFYGTESKVGTGINIGTNTGSTLFIYNNIFYGLTTAISSNAAINVPKESNNDFFNNTNNYSNFYTGQNDSAINPVFTNVSQVTGTTATSATTVLTDSGKNFTTAGVVAGRDFLTVTSATGATLGIYGITSVGTTTLTLDNTIGTGSAITYNITVGRNWNQTGLNNTLGYPASYPLTNQTPLTIGNFSIGASFPASSGGASAYAWTK